MSNTNRLAPPQGTIRYFVAPADTRNGWFVRNVVLDASGKETTGTFAERFTSKKAAHTFKLEMNAKVTK